jgi:hypothetical protein
MESTQISNRKKIADTLLAIYNQHEYEVKQENFKLTVFQLETVLEGLNTDKFFAKVSHGDYGVLYRMPTSILSMAHKYRVENILRMP